MRAALVPQSPVVMVAVTNRGDLPCPSEARLCWLPQGSAHRLHSWPFHLHCYGNTVDGHCVMKNAHISALTACAQSEHASSYTHISICTEQAYAPCPSVTTPSVPHTSPRTHQQPLRHGNPSTSMQHIHRAHSPSHYPPSGHLHQQLLHCGHTTCIYLALFPPPHAHSVPLTRLHMSPQMSKPTY